MISLLVKYFSLFILCFLMPHLCLALQLDAQFGNGGTVLTSLSDGTDRGEMVAITNDGNILVAGEVDWGGKQDIGVVRYDERGRLDKRFGNGGKVVIDLGGQEEIHGLLALKDGGIVLGGLTRTKKKSDFALVKLLPQGQLDEGFGRHGRVITHLGDQDEIHYLALHPDGFIVAAGFTRSRGNTDAVLIGYNLNGEIDEHFGQSGIVRGDFGVRDRLYGMDVNQDGKIFVTGSIRQTGSSDDCLVLSYGSDGSLDPNFGEAGKLVIEFSKAQDVCAAISVSEDRTIVVAGFSERQKGNTEFAVAKILPSGSLDVNFGNQGMVSTDFFGRVDIAHAILMQDKQIMVSGEYQRWNVENHLMESGFGLILYSLRGISSDGPYTHSFRTYNTELANAMTWHDKKIILAGQSGNSFSIIQYKIK